MGLTRRLDVSGLYLLLPFTRDADSADLLGWALRFDSVAVAVDGVDVGFSPLRQDCEEDGPVEVTVRIPLLLDFICGHVPPQPLVVLHLAPSVAHTVLGPVHIYRTTLDRLLLETHLLAA